MLYQSTVMNKQFEGLNLTVTALKASDIRLHGCRAIQEQFLRAINNELLPYYHTIFHPKVKRLIKRVGSSYESANDLIF